MEINGNQENEKHSTKIERSFHGRRFINEFREAPFKLFTDYTVKQGIKYKYAIIQYNDYELQSNKIESNIISSD